MCWRLHYKLLDVNTLSHLEVHVKNTNWCFSCKQWFGYYYQFLKHSPKRTNEKLCGWKLLLSCAGLFWQQSWQLGETNRLTHCWINWHCQLEGLTLSIACSQIFLQQCEQLPMLHLMIAFTSGTSAKKVWFSLSTCWRSFTLPMSGWLLNVKNTSSTAHVLKSCAILNCQWGEISRSVMSVPLLLAELAGAMRRLRSEYWCVLESLEREQGLQMNVPVKHLPKGIDACHLSPIEMIFQACQQGHRAKPIAKIVFLLPYFFPIWVSQVFFVEGFQGSSESYVCHFLIEMNGLVMMEEFPIEVQEMLKSRHP